MKYFTFLSLNKKVPFQFPRESRSVPTPLHASPSLSKEEKSSSLDCYILAFKIAYTTSFTVQLTVLLSCVELWKEMLGSAPNCQPSLVLLSRLIRGRFLLLLLHWPTTRFTNPHSKELWLTEVLSPGRSYSCAHLLHYTAILSKGTLQEFCVDKNRHKFKKGKCSGQTDVLQDGLSSFSGRSNVLSPL